MSKSLIGNLLVLTLFILSFLFFYVVINGRALDAGLMMFVFLFFYFLGKGIYFNIDLKNKDYSYLFKTLVIVVPMTISVALCLLYKNISFSLVGSLLAFLLLIIGIDYKGHIDNALEAQVYKEMPKNYNSLNIILYVSLAVALIIFFPYM